MFFFCHNQTYKIVKDMQIFFLRIEMSTSTDIVSLQCYVELKTSALVDKTPLERNLACKRGQLRGRQENEDKEEGL